MKSVLITRPEPQASALAAALPVGWHPVISPLIEIVNTGAELDLNGVGGLIFTSLNGVQAVRDQLVNCKLPVWCVGERTAMETQQLGLQTWVAGGEVGSLERLILKQQPEGCLLYIRGKYSATDLRSRLQAQAIDVGEVVVYDQKPLTLTDAAKTGLQNGDLRAVMLFSPRTARIFAAEVSGFNLTGMRLLCLSQNVADALGQIIGVKIETALRPDQAEMLELITR